MKKKQLKTKYFKLLETTPDGILIADSKGFIVFINHQIEQLFGYSKDELLNQKVEFLIPERLKENHERFRDNYIDHPTPRVMETGRELYAKKKDGSEFLVEIGLTPIIIDNETYISASIRNMSEKIKNRKQFKDLLDTSIDAMLLIDKNRVIREINKQAEMLFDYSRSEILSQDVALLIPEHFVQEYAKHQNDLFINKKTIVIGIEMEIFGKKKKGEQFPVEISLTTIEMEHETLISAIIRDITSRKAFEQQLKESEQRFKSLVDIAIDSIITLDDQGKILSYNHASETIFGYSSEYILSKSINMLLADTNNLEIRKAIANHSENNSFFEKYHKILCTRQNGQTFPAEVSLSRMKSKENTLFIWILRDITERERLNKMKTEFVSTVSHELRTPLTSIKGAISLILIGKGDQISEEMQNLLEMANRNADRLTLLINDILDLEKIEGDKMVFKMETIDLVQFIPLIVQSDLVYAQQFHVTLECDIPFDKLFIVSDKQRLMQVLTNLLSNAVKFSYPQGVVTVKVERINDKIRISVVDHGCGIPATFQTKLFEKFVQVDSSNTRKKGGTGLGLSIAKMITQKLGGTIGFTSKEGKGSTFYIELDEKIES